MAAWLVFVAAAISAETGGTIAAARRLILAHYMPWYEAKPASSFWGWHWTMNHFDPEKMTDGRREVASHFYPLIGPYDSGDPHVLEYHLLKERSSSQAVSLAFETWRSCRSYAASTWTPDSPRWPPICVYRINCWSSVGRRLVPTKPDNSTESPNS
jgi:hypothetical protein